MVQKLLNNTRIGLNIDNNNVFFRNEISNNIKGLIDHFG